MLASITSFFIAFLGMMGIASSCPDGGVVSCAVECAYDDLDDFIARVALKRQEILDKRLKWMSATPLNSKTVQDAAHCR